MFTGLNFGELSRQLQKSVDGLASNYIKNNHGLNAKLKSMEGHTDSVIPERPLDPEGHHKFSELA
jgi:hypothetical protein